MDRLYLWPKSLGYSYCMLRCLTMARTNSRQPLMAVSKLCLLIILALALPSSSVFLDESYGWQQSANDNLGIRVITPVYARVPVTADKRNNVTVVLTVWMRRIGAAAGACELPHQAKDAIRIMVWADDPSALFIRKYGHLWLPVNHHDWTPQFEIETDDPGPVIPAELETTAEHLFKVPEPPLRPFSFVVPIPPGSGNCFKLVETSYKRFKHPFCLPPASEDTLCTTLAPPERYTAEAPALWLAIGPVRHTNSPRLFTQLTNQVAQRIEHYLTYHVAMGASGLLLYADELTRNYLRRNPQTAALVRAGTLRFVHWEMQEREHEINDNMGRILGYNYDQALVGGHLFLGLSACGTNLLVLISDLDEYLYSPQPGNRWPLPFGTCMLPQSGGVDPIAIYTLSRIEVLSAKASPANESSLWILPGVNGSSAGGKKAPHPLSNYDMIYRKPMKNNHNKPITLPASQIVAFFVHEGTPLQLNATREVDIDCLVLLHLPNYFRQRTTNISTYVKLDDTQFRPFSHWMIDKDGSIITHEPHGIDLSALMHGGKGRLGALAGPLLVVGLVLIGFATVLKLILSWYQARAARRWRH